MSLNWSLEAIKDYETICWIGEPGSIDRRMNPVTETLIFGTMSVGLGSITDKNVDEFSARFRIMEGVHGAFLYKIVDGEKQDWFLSDEDFIAHIGLGCNVTNESRTKWAQRIFVAKQTSITEELARKFNRNREQVSA